MLKQFIFDPDRAMMYDVEKIRNKYKVISHQLGVVLSFQDGSSPLNQDLSF